MFQPSATSIPSSNADSTTLRRHAYCAPRHCGMFSTRDLRNKYYNYTVAASVTSSAQILHACTGRGGPALGRPFPSATVPGGRVRSQCTGRQSIQVAAPRLGKLVCIVYCSLTVSLDVSLLNHWPAHRQDATRHLQVRCAMDGGQEIDREDIRSH